MALANLDVSHWHRDDWELARDFVYIENGWDLSDASKEDMRIYGIKPKDPTPTWFTYKCPTGRGRYMLRGAVRRIIKDQTPKPQ